MLQVSADKFCQSQKSVKNNWRIDPSFSPRGKHTKSAPAEAARGLRLPDLREAVLEQRNLRSSASLLMAARETAECPKT